MLGARIWDYCLPDAPADLLVCKICQPKSLQRPSRRLGEESPLNPYKSSGAGQDLERDPWHKVFRE